MSTFKKLAIGLTSATLIAPTFAAELTVTVENLTRSTFFTPLIVAAHPEGSRLFTTGAAASSELQAMAEGGDISGLETILTSIGATQSNNPAEGLLVAGASATTSLNTDGTSNVLLSIAGMLLPTNDGFVAINSVEIPTEVGTYTFYAKAYDAGTEANDEVIGSGAAGEAGFPAPPPVAETTGSDGTGVAATAEGHVHIHRGVLGDTDATGGVSDIDSTMHRWLNPVAKITVTVN